MKRMIDTGTWDDPWFADLEPDTKLVFLYLLTNRRSTAAGAFEITIRAMSFETGIAQKRIESILDILQSRVQWWPEYQIIWVRKFFKHQAANENFTKSAQASVKEMPHAVQCAIGVLYPSLVPEGVICPDVTGTDTHPNGYATGSDTPSAVIDIAIDTEKGRDSTDNGADAPVACDPPYPQSPPEPKPPRYTADFESFWKAYPTGHGVKKQTFDQWRKIPADERQAVMDGLDAWKMCDRWKRGYVKDAQRWLRDRQWDDEPPAEPASTITVHNGGKPTPGKRGYTMGELIEMSRNLTDEELEAI